MSTEPLKQNKAWVGWLLALGTSLAFSTTPPVVRSAVLSGLEPTELLVNSFTLAIALLWLTFFIRRPNAAKPVPLLGIGRIALVGLVSGLAQISIFSALTRLESSIVSMILAMLPIFVLLFLAFLGEPLTRRKIIRLVLAMVGLYLLIGPGGQIDIIGLGFIIAAIFLFTIQFVFSQPLVRQYDTQTVTRYFMTMMLVVIITYWWFVDGQWQWPSSQGWFYIGFLGFVSTYIARTLFYAAIDHLGSGQMSLMVPLETLISISWAVIFLGERLSLIQWVGGILVVSSAILAIQRIRLGKWPLRWRVGSWA